MKILKTNCYIFILTGVMFLSGCASWTPSIQKNYVPTENDSYLYGRFKIKAPKSFWGVDGHQTMGFVYSCDDKMKYTIRFGMDNAVQVIRLKPASCSLMEIIFTNAAGTIMSRKPAPIGIFNSIVLEPGIAYYLGDFFAITTNSTEYDKYHMTWNVKDVRNAYVETTDEMKLIYPNLSNIQTRDQMSAGVVK